MNIHATPQLIPKTREKDRFFNPWRRPASDRATRMIECIIHTVLTWEADHRPRKRARKVSDHQTFVETVTAIVSDLVYVSFLGIEELAIPRSNRNLGRKSRYRSSVMGKKLPYILDILAASSVGLISQELGCRNPFVRYQRTKFKMTERLRYLVETNDLDVSDFTVDRSREVIVLRTTKEHAGKSPQDMEYEDDANTLAMRAAMTTINDHIAGADLEVLPGYGSELLDTNDRHLRRIFTRGSFSSGGRLYGGFWQSMDKRDRRMGLLIEGEHVIEIDYGQMAPRLLYALAGAAAPDGDAYYMDGLAVPELYRDGFKKLFNALLFTEKPLTRKPKETVKKLPNAPVSELVELVKEKHRTIAHLLEAGIGHALQLKESELMVELLLRLIEERIVALPIHDAILVKERDAQAAASIMREVFERRTGQHPILHIER